MPVRAGLAVAPSCAAIDPAAVSPMKTWMSPKGTMVKLVTFSFAGVQKQSLGDDREVLHVEDATHGDGIADAS